MSVEAAGGGRTRITARALDRVITAVTRDAFDSHSQPVSVDATDNGGVLDLAVKTSIAVAPLERVRHDSTAVQKTGGSVIDRCAAAEASIRTRVQALTGYTVQRITVQITAAHVNEERRVR